MRPTTKSESYDNFMGIDNIGDSTQIIKRPKTTFGGRGAAQIRMLQAENVDLHSDAHFSRCDGYALALAGAYTNVWSNDSICLAVNAGNLVQINADISATILLYNLGTNDVAYETVNDGATSVVYFTNGIVIGKIRNGAVSLLSVTTKEFKAVLPAGDFIRYFQGSLYVVKDKAVYISDVLNHEIYDRRWGFKLFETTIRMFEPVKDGIYVSDSENVFFMKRTGSTQDVAAAPIFSLTKVYESPVVPGTPCRVKNVTTPGNKSHEQAIIWVSGTTLCIGGESGAFETIRDDAYSVPSGRIGTSVVRSSGDLEQYLTIIR